MSLNHPGFFKTKKMIGYEEISGFIDGFYIDKCDLHEY